MKPASSTTTTTTTGLLPTPSKPLPFHKLSPEAISQRRKDGLCFRCPAKYSPGHVCSPPQFLFIVDQEDSDQPLPSAALSADPTMEPPEFMALSPSDFFGMSSQQTLRLAGYIDGKPVTVLIDCGSTHNIIEPRIAEQFTIPTLPMVAFPVMVGNGQHITCEGHCPEVPLGLNDAAFVLPFFLFQIHEADVVLENSWLDSLRRIQADFAIPELSFTRDNITTTLRWSSAAKPVTAGSLASLIRHDEIASFHTLTMQPTISETTHTPSAPDPAISTLVSAYPDLFTTPHSLPPSRPSMFDPTDTLIFKNRS